MNVKNFIIGGIVGGIVDFLLGWLVWGILLKDTFPMPEGAGAENMMFIALGCMSFGFLISWVYSQGVGITTMMEGAKVGAGIGFFMGLSNSFFEYMYKDAMDLKLVAISVVASTIVAAVVGAAVSTVNSKMK